MNNNYVIKQIPEDFVVKEVSEIFEDEFKETGKSGKSGKSGKYIIFKFLKKNYTTEKAIQTIADALHIKRKDFGSAGNKDSCAITEQSISIKGVSRERVKNIILKDIKLEFVGFLDEPISLGDLKGNNFEIVVRNIDKEPVCLKRMINYFGEQRFSRNNAEVGKFIIKNDFKSAVELLLESDGMDEVKVKEYLETRKNDYVGAIKTIPWNTLKLFVHAYQSKLWNEVAAKIAARGLPPSEEPEIIPILGFGTEFENKEVENIYKEIMQKEEISLKDFVIRAIPDLSSDGTERKLYVNVEDLDIGKLEDDDLNHGKKKILVKFFLKKGSYATEVVKAMFGDV